MKVKMKHVHLPPVPFLAFTLLFSVFLEAVGQTAAKNDETLKLTLDSAINLALKRNEQAIISRENVNVSLALASEAKAAILPAVNFTGIYTRNPFSVQRQVGDTTITVQKYNALNGTASFNMPIFNSDAIPEYRSAKFTGKASSDTAREEMRQLAFQVSKAYVEALTAAQLIEASNHRFAYARQNLDAAQARYNAGLTSINDVTRAELEYATAEMSVIQSQGQESTTLQQLSYLLDLPDIDKYTLAIPEDIVRSSEKEEFTAGPLIAEAQARRLDLSSLRWTARAQQALVVQPTLKWFPSLSLTGQYRYTNQPGLTGRSYTWNLGATLTWALFDGFSRNAEYREEKALANITDLNLKAGLRSVEVDVRQALIVLANQRAALKQSAVALEIARRNSTQTNELYRQGLASALQVADANVSLFEAEVAYAQQRYGLVIAYLNIESAIGLDSFGKEPQW